MNPALELYEFWRAIVKFKMTNQLNDMRALVNKSNNDPETASRYRSHHLGFVLDRTSGLYVAGITPPNNGQLPIDPDDPSVWEPIIGMGPGSYRGSDARIGSSTTPVFTLWPDGSFLIDNWGYFRLLHKHTFVHWSWAKRDRVFVVADNTYRGLGAANRHDGEIYRWENLDVESVTRRRPYLPMRYTSGGILRVLFPGDHRLNLVESANGDWLITSPESDQQDRLDSGYAIAERRYQRYERAAELAANPNLRRRRIGEITTGRLTATETVERMTGLMKVYDPRPKEAP